MFNIKRDESREEGFLANKCERMDSTFGRLTVVSVGAGNPQLFKNTREKV